MDSLHFSFLGRHLEVGLPGHMLVEIYACVLRVLRPGPRSRCSVPRPRSQAWPLWGHRVAPPRAGLCCVRRQRGGSFPCPPALCTSSGEVCPDLRPVSKTRLFAAFPGHALRQTRGQPASPCHSRGLPLLTEPVPCFACFGDSALGVMSKHLAEPKGTEVFFWKFRGSRSHIRLALPFCPSGQEA